jgi:hypothetical protein
MLVWFFRIAIWLGLHHVKKIDTFLDIDQKYVDPIKTRFATLFCNPHLNHYNENIDSLFYNKKAYTEYMQEQNTELERSWRTRMLLEHTSRGNVLMFYDPFKMGFSFYSDEKTMSYDVLNTVAMKYVSIYRCLDFFVDESVVPKEQRSPFIKLYLTEEPKKKIVDKTTFAKLRQKNPNTKEAEPCLEEPEKIKNKFLYLGKMHNSCFTQPAPKARKVLAKFTSPLLETIKLDAGVQRDKLSYKDFKKAQSEATDKSEAN